MAELLAFAKDADKNGLLDLIEDVSYDSVSCICHITPKAAHKDILKFDRHPVMNVAMRHISQFEWTDEIKHSPEKEREAFERGAS